ncbi:hypothetical protein MPH_05416 [Macrophomina phaseolina MS6]|uniref:Uncharacterized protein n=1 Tax=Macrophomina phaseolina (strain MS6) TaxID=1126212 RepID=K2SKM6_MACPH|nr:hypothetical protein MPH_05416 [Macrophomina phaseolina MS6]
MGDADQQAGMLHISHTSAQRVTHVARGTSEYTVDKLDDMMKIQSEIPLHKFGFSKGAVDRCQDQYASARERRDSWLNTVSYEEINWWKANNANIADASDE